MTTTTIRTLVETTASQMMDEGTITQTQRKAIMNINGHTSQTTEDYYLLKDRRNDAKNGSVMFDALLHDSDIAIPSRRETIDTNTSLNTPPPQVLGSSQFASSRSPQFVSPWNRSSSAVQQWGTLHPTSATSETGAPLRRVQ